MKNLTNEYKRIKKLVEEKTGIEDISIPNRSQDNVKARYLYFKLCQEFFKHTFKKGICSDLVNRKQEMVLYGIKEFDNLIDTPYYKDVAGFYSICAVELDLNVKENDGYVLQRLLKMQEELDSFIKKYVGKIEITHELITP